MAAAASTSCCALRKTAAVHERADGPAASSLPASAWSRCVWLGSPATTSPSSCHLCVVVYMCLCVCQSISQPICLSVSLSVGLSACACFCVVDLSPSLSLFKPPPPLITNAHQHGNVQDTGDVSDIFQTLLRSHQVGKYGGLLGNGKRRGRGKERNRERERERERKRERRRQNAHDRGTNKHRAPGQQTHSPGPRLTTPTATHSQARTSAPFADNTTDKDTQTAAGGKKRKIETEARGMAQRGLGFRCCRGRRVLLVLELLCKLVAVHSNVVLGILRIESRVWRAAVCAPRSLSLGPSLSLAHLLSLLLSWLPSSATLPGCRGQCDPFQRWERP